MDELERKDISRFTKAAAGVQTSAHRVNGQLATACAGHGVVRATPHVFREGGINCEMCHGRRASTRASQSRWHGNTNELSRR